METIKLYLLEILVKLVVSTVVTTENTMTLSSDKVVTLNRLLVFHIICWLRKVDLILMRLARLAR